MGSWPDFLLMWESGYERLGKSLLWILTIGICASHPLWKAEANIGITDLEAMILHGVCTLQSYIYWIFLLLSACLAYVSRWITFTMWLKCSSRHEHSLAGQLCFFFWWSGWKGEGKRQPDTMASFLCQTQDCKRFKSDWSFQTSTWLLHSSHKRSNY